MATKKTKSEKIKYWKTIATFDDFNSANSFRSQLRKEHKDHEFKIKRSSLKNGGTYKVKVYPSIKKQKSQK